MYLSKIHISAKVAKEPYNHHKELWSLFPEDPEKKRDFLFRVERHERSEGATILLQSEREPFQSNDHCKILAKREFLWSFNNSDIFQFKLVANPTKKIHEEKALRAAQSKDNGKRVPLIKEDDLDHWLIRKMSPFSKLLDFSHRQSGNLFFRKKSNAGKIALVCFEGVIQVTERDELTKVFHEGIGPAKGFGCGMLSLARR